MTQPSQNEIVVALQLISHGDPDAAHEMVQRRNDAAACRVHALIHRMEGDLGNAAFWYRRAGAAVPDCDTGRELELMLNEFGAC